MLEAREIVVVKNQRRLLDGVSARFAAGKVTAILGPNGAGKSTLVKALSGEWPLAGGDVVYGARSVTRLRPSELAGMRAIVPQNTYLSFDFAVLEVVMLGITVPGFGLDTDRSPARDALADVGLGGFEQRRYTQLSGGEKQRVHIARALCQLRVGRPLAPENTVLVLDEPTASLDPAHQVLVLSVLCNEAAIGRTVIAVLHDLNLAAAWADEVLLMRGGRLLAQGAPVSVFTDTLLSDAYDCVVRVNAPPADGAVFVLPHHLVPQRTLNRGGTIVQPRVAHGASID